MQVVRIATLNWPTPRLKKSGFSDDVTNMVDTAGRDARRLDPREALVRVIASVALAAGGVYLVWRLLWTWQGSNPVMFVVLFTCEAFGWLMLATFTFLAWRIPRRSRPPIGKNPTVAIFVCTYDEGLHVLEATLVGCDRITYPHTTYVLDDGRRREVRQLADSMGAAYVTRPTNEHAKAGNINHALAHTDGDLLLMLDADHVPQPDILDATVGYFDDERMALVQTPHDFRNHDSFQHFATGRHDQSMFFEVIMPGKDRHNGAYWCGSAAVISRRALNDIGGIATETVAEDFHTTIRLHRHGWRTRYHDETLVQGLAPHDLASFLLQRDRWARGNLAVFRTDENPLTASGLTLKQRVSYLSSLLAYFVPIQRLVMLAVLMTMLVGGITPVSAPAWQLAAFWLPWISLELAAGTLLSRGQVSPWDGSYTILLTTEIFTRAVFVLLRPFRVSFRVTPKDGIDDGGWAAARQLRLVLAVTGLLMVSILLRVLAMAGVLTLPHLGTLAIGLGISFAAWEMFIVGAALWRVTRRHQVRLQYRIPVAIAGLIDNSLVRIVDLTPDGAAFVGSSPMGRDEETSLRMELPMIDGGTQTVRTRFTVHSCRTDGDLGWRIGGTLVTQSQADREALIEHCHVVGGRSRLIKEGRLEPEAPIIYRVEDHFADGQTGDKVS
jgi:cellulose synthase (UDP-forming)